jgi:D-hydroxyproline dehydrogenase subunit gamma
VSVARKFHVRMSASEPPDCRINVDGHDIAAYSGQSLAAVLVSAGSWAVRSNPVSGEHRGPFCGMGVCFECEVDVVGLGRARSCLVEVSEGMVVRTSRTHSAEA